MIIFWYLNEENPRNIKIFFNVFLSSLYNADIILQPHELHAKVNDIWYSQWREQRRDMGHNTANLCLLQFILARKIGTSFSLWW